MRKRFEKGFTKRYDVNNIVSRDFRIKVSTEEATVVYRIEFSKDRKKFEPYLEEVTQHLPSLASNN
jgi:hypothetical protein